RFHSSSYKVSRCSLAHTRNARFPGATGDAAGAATVRVDIQIRLATVCRARVAIPPAGIARQTAHTTRAGRRAILSRRAGKAARAATGDACVEVHFAAISGEAVA